MKIENKSLLWDNLKKITFFTVKATFSTEQNTICGKGQVESTPLNKTRLLLEETGSWDGGISFTTAYLWDRNNHEIRVSHHREMAPVFLCVLEEYEGGWRSRTPHLCGDDCYSLYIEPMPQGLRMIWKIKGPQKDQIVEYLYSFGNTVS